MSRKARNKKVRACVRCGCTDARACERGCEWVAGSNVCDACLTPMERRLWVELVLRVTDSERLVNSAAAALENSRQCLTAFGHTLNAGGDK